MTTTHTIELLHVPERLDASDAADFHRMVELHNQVCLADTGRSDLDATAEEMLPDWQDHTDHEIVTFVVREEGEIAGVGLFEYAIAEPTSASIDVMVPPQHWGRGIEDALLAEAERRTQELGRGVLQAWTLHPVADARSTLQRAVTGWGEVAETSLSRLITANGFTLEQVERTSAFDLQRPLDDVQRKYAEARAFAGPDYRLVEWTVPTAPEWQDDYARIISRMSTDAPSAGLDVDEEVWDAARLRRREERLIAGGQAMSVAAVQHVPSGRLVAFNELTTGSDPAGITHQYSTLVLAEHRGHRLGMLVKCANILRWREIAPESPRISTFNAEENRPMLDINEAIGFRPVSYAGAWQKRLAAGA